VTREVSMQHGDAQRAHLVRTWLWAFPLFMTRDLLAKIRIDVSLKERAIFYAEAGADGGAIE
jgi:hypothetical protein